MKKIITKIMFGCCLYALLPLAGNSQNYVDATNDASIVPIELLSFKAVLQGNNVQIDWATATEINNSHFNVLRSLNGKNFSSIGTVKGNGNSSTIYNYTLVDASFPKQNLYYQLEQVDFDGKKTLSAIVMVKIDANNQVQIFIFPNPVKDKKSSIMMNNIPEGIYNILIQSAIGVTIFNQQWKATSNVPLAIQLPANLQPGMYILKVQANTLAVKIAKQLLIY